MALRPEVKKKPQGIFVAFGLFRAASRREKYFSTSVFPSREPYDVYQALSGKAAKSLCKRRGPRLETKKEHIRRMKRP